MKKLVFMDNTERDAFKSYCKTIKGIEADKDMFLKASRLERHESKREPFRAADIIRLAIILGLSLICCTILVLGYLSGDLGNALFAIGVFTFIGGFMALIASGLRD